MDSIFPFVRKKGANRFFDIFGLAVTVLACFLSFGIRWPLAFAVCWLAMMINLISLAAPDIFDTVLDRFFKRINFYLASFGCTIAFAFNLLVFEGKVFLITLPFEEIGISSLIFIIICFVIYFISLLIALDINRTDRKKVHQARATAVKMKGIDGKEYRMPGDTATGWEIERELSDFSLTCIGGKEANALLEQRMADLMYEEFQRKIYELSERPIKRIEDKNWGVGKALDPQKLWAGYAYDFHAATAKHFELQGLYDKAKEYIDRGIAILLKRGNYVMRSTIIDSKELREKIYSHFPNTVREPAVEKAYSQLLNRAYAKQAEVEREMREYEAGAAERRLEREARYDEEEERERKKEKLRAEYEAKTKEVDDWFNAIASAQDGTVYSDWHDSRIPVDGVDADTYRRREFLRDEKKDQYRKEYEEDLRKLDDK